MINSDSPNLVIIGNIAYDIIDFSKIKSERGQLVEIGGACTFSTIPASLFYRVGMVGKIGNDFDISNFYNYNIDLAGVIRIDKPTTKFYTTWNTTDGQDREVTGVVSKEMIVSAKDIPTKFLKAKHFHLTTAEPSNQFEIIEFLRQNTNATISVDTIDDFANQTLCRKVFDNVDIAFIDKEYTNLLSCKANTKIVKYGKEGCLYCSPNKNFYVYSQVIEDVVDKTGAGDCLNGVFLNLKINGMPEEKALRKAVDVATESIKHNGILNLKYNLD